MSVGLEPSTVVCPSTPIAGVIGNELCETKTLTSREPIILTGSKDTNMLLGELDATDYQ